MAEEKYIYKSLMDCDNMLNQYRKDVLPILFGLKEPPKYKQYGAGNKFGNKFNDLRLNVTNIEFTDNKFDPNSSTFYHFTSLRVLFSILNSSSIRLYNLKGFNDPKEYEYFAKELKIPEAIIEEYKDSTFVFSMCDDKIIGSNNELTHWRLYGQDGSGVALKLSINVHPSRNFFHFLGKVNYDLPDFELFFKKHNEFCLKYDVALDVEGCIPIPALLHKNDQYSIENEVRLVYFSKDPKIKDEPDFIKFLDNVVYNDVNSRNSLVKYIELPLNKKNDNNQPEINIEEIIIGFKHDSRFIKLKEKILDIVEKNVNEGHMEKVPKIISSNLYGQYH